jgi:hypothetical protein
VRRAPVEIERADVDEATIDEGELRVQPPDRRAEQGVQLVVLLQPLRAQLVELDAREQQLALVPLEADQRQRLVADREGVGDDAHPHPALPKRAQPGPCALVGTKYGEKTTTSASASSSRASRRLATVSGSSGGRRGAAFPGASAMVLAADTRIRLNRPLASWARKGGAPNRSVAGDGAAPATGVVRRSNSRPSSRGSARTDAVAVTMVRTSYACSLFQ